MQANFLWLEGQPPTWANIIDLLGVLNTAVLIPLVDHGTLFQTLSCRATENAKTLFGLFWVAFLKLADAVIVTDKNPSASKYELFYLH